MGSSPHTEDTDTTQNDQNAPAFGGSRTLSPLQLYYLRLLERLFHQRETYETDPEREEWLQMAISRAGYSAFRSCVENGVEEEAKALLEQQRA
jgi:hypothetical protein